MKASASWGRGTCVYCFSKAASAGALEGYGDPVVYGLCSLHQQAFLDFWKSLGTARIYGLEEAEDLLLSGEVLRS